MDELRDRVRKELDRLESSPGGYEKTLRRVRRRQRNKRLGAASLGLVLTGSLGVGLWTVARTERQPHPSPAASFQLPDGGMVFAAGRLIRSTPDGSQVLATLPGDIAPVPPVLTPSGVIVLTGGPSIGLDLWLVSLDGSVRQIDHDVTAGFVIDPNDDVVAYATTTQGTAPPLFSTFVHVVRLGDGAPVSTSSELRFYAQVEGIVDGNILLSTGDGASASVGLWSPTEDRVWPFSNYGRALGADPATGLALVNVGDGPTPLFVRFHWNVPNYDSPIAGEIVIDGSVSQLQGIDFSPDGGRVAGLQPRREGVELVVVDERTGAVTFRADLPGGSQAVWFGTDTILVLDKTGPQATLDRCDLSTGGCVTGDVDLGSPGPFGYGIWLVRGVS